MIERECLMMDKLDQLITEVHKIDKNVIEIKKGQEGFEKTNTEIIKRLEERFDSQEKRIEKLEGYIKWAVILVVGYVITQLLGLIGGL